MKIKKFLLERMTIEEFGEKNDLVMEIHERYVGRPVLKLDRFYARFSHLDLFDGVFIIGTFGNGNTPEEAIKDYARKLSGQRVLMNAFGNRKEREFRVPVLEEK